MSNVQLLVLERVAVCCSLVQCVAVVAVCCSVLQCVAVCCSVLETSCQISSFLSWSVCSMCCSVCCSVLRRVRGVMPNVELTCIGVCCSVMQCDAV